MFIDCLAYGGTGAATNGFQTTNNGVYFINCTSYGNADGGFFFTGGFSGHVLINCVSTGNTGLQFELGTTTETSHRLFNCAAKADGAGAHNLNAVELIGFIILTADPFTNAAGGDFSLNSTAGGGAALKALGLPSLYPGSSTTSFPDIGAAQTSGAAAGGLMYNPGMEGGIRGG
jgi:hypothetical protein